MQKDDLEYKTKLNELDRIRGEIRKKLAQEYHWDAQRRHWRYIFIASIIAIILNTLKSLWS